MKAIVLALVSASALAGSASLASAQQWDPWDGPRRSPQDDYRYDDPQADDRYFDQQDGPRTDNRYGDPDSDPRRYDPRYNGEPGTNDRASPPYPGRPVYGGDRYRDDAPANYGYRDNGSVRDRDDGQRYGNDPYGGSRYDRDDDGAWDAAPSREEEERLSKTQGTSAGSRPYIRPVAPPKVAFSGPYAPGSIVIDTSARKLYYVLTSSTAYAYPIGVGRQGFAWTGKEKVSRIADWPDWYPPADMRKRKPELPVRMLGGIRNPLGAKAIYLGNTLYRIHGTNEPKSIGTAASSGCFRMMNENVLHLASLVHVGTEVTVVRSLGGRVASNAKAPTLQTKAAERAPQSRIINRSGDQADGNNWDPYNGWH